MEKRKELTIPSGLMESDWKSDKVVIKRPTGGDLMRVRDESQGKEGIAVILTVRGTVIEAPWKVNDSTAIQNIDGGLFLWLVKEIEAFINFSNEEKKN